MSTRETAASSARGVPSRAPRRQHRDDNVDDFVHENPLAVGAFALAVGAAIGLALRVTEYENRAMGATRDEAVARAKNSPATSSRTSRTRS